MRLCVAASCGLLLAFQTLAGPLRIVPNDFDGDRRSDLVSYDLEEVVKDRVLSICTNFEIRQFAM